MKFFTEKSQTPPKEKVLDNRTLLKFARQYIDENNMKKAQQYCKKVLRKGNKCYMALVLLGKSYGKSVDALLSYEKAIELKPNHLLAWQGLANYYEAKDDESAKIKLPNIYDKLLSLNIDEDYAIKTLKKYGQLGCLLKNNDMISSLLNYITIQDNENLKETAKTQVLQLLQFKVTCKNEDIPAVINLINNVNVSDLTNDHSELIFLGNLMLKNYDFTSAVQEIISLKLFSKSLFMKNWLCKVLCETFVKTGSFCDFDVNFYINALITGIEDTKYGSFLTAITYYKHMMYEEAYRKCINSLTDPCDIEEIEAFFLINCSKHLPDQSRTKHLCNYLLRKEHLNSPALTLTLNSTLLSYHIEQKEFYKSLHYLKPIPIGQIDSIVLTEIASLYLELDIINSVTFDTLDQTDYLDFFKALAFIKNKQFSEAIKLLQIYDKHPLKYYYLALSYWFINLTDASFENFKKSAELIPNHPKIHYCLGIHYFRKKNDIEESKKHFERSYNLCKTDINVVKMLSIIYERLGLVDLEFELLQSAFNISQTKKFWVCTKLGSICFNRGIKDDALIYLQAAIDFQPEDLIAQEWIGDIYFSKKNYNQALTAYSKVVELSQDSLVFFKCLNRIGCIYSEQTFYHQAVYIFDYILDNDASNVMALKGITENRIIVALKNITNNLFPDAREQMQCVANRITTAMSIGIKDLVYWHLFGDVLIFMTRLPNEHRFVNLQSAEGEIRKENIDIFKMAIESYSNVVKFRDSIALFKCALVYYEYYCETKNIVFCQTSYNLAVLYMKVNPSLWPIWDLLGKICLNLDKSKTAYYCFSKAVCLFENSDSKIWCDLAVFYAKLDKQRLMRYRHIIERFLPNFTPPWIREELSQSLNNDDSLEYILDDLLNLEEIENIESVEIQSNQPSSSQCCEPKFENPIESLKIVPNAAELIEWYFCFEEETAWTCCSLGNLQETKGLYIPALRYYDRAYEIADDSLKNEILLQKGRVLMKMKEYEEAVNMYNSVREKNLEDTCALGCALYKLEKYKNSYAIYDEAFNNLCENDEQRVDVLITMSNVAYQVYGLNDGAMLILKALKIKHGQDQDFSLSFLKSYAFKKVNIQLVSHIMTEYLHKHVDKSTWWYYMGLNYLRGINKYAELTGACIKRAIRTNSEPCKNGKLYALISVAEFYAGNRHTSLDYATRALKLYPAQPELWAVFILCIYADKTWPRKAFFMRVVIDTVRKLINVSQPMDKWLTKVEEEVIGQPKKFNFTFECNSILP